jgi:hypothetical protein
MMVLLVLGAMGHIQLSFGRSNNFFLLKVEDSCAKDVGPRKLVDCLYKLGWIFEMPGTSKMKLVKAKVDI